MLLLVQAFHHSQKAMPIVPHTQTSAIERLILQIFTCKVYEVDKVRSRVQDKTAWQKQPPPRSSKTWRSGS